MNSAGNLAECLDIGAPVVHAEEFGRHVAVHVLELRGLHGGMGAESGEHRFHAVAVVLPGVASEVAGAGMEAGHVRRNGQHALSFAELGQALREQIVQLRRREIGFRHFLRRNTSSWPDPVLFNSKYRIIPESA